MVVKAGAAFSLAGLAGPPDINISAYCPCALGACQTSQQSTGHPAVLLSPCDVVSP